MHRILFLCQGHSGRALMAQEFALKLAPKDVEILSATDTAVATHPLAREVMREYGYELPDHSLLFENVLNRTFDIVITLCVKMQEDCPLFPGSPANIHWGLTDPLVMAQDPMELLKHFRRTRDGIRSRVWDLFEHGYFDSIIEQRSTFRKILNTMTDGVLAHDKKRSIFFFNRAAEEITGYKAHELIGRDCHIIMPGQFCGKDCDLCMKNLKVDQRLHIPVEFTRKDGTLRDLEISIVPILTAENQRSGALIVFRDMTEVNRLRTQLEEGRGFHGLIGVHPAMQKIYSTIRYLANVNVPILIQGESGTGKELAARALHQLSNRKDKPFVPLNCGALPEGTLESELFGHVKGAFTSAIRDKKGRFELADQGVLFLDEIGDISLNVQVKLLRVLQENSFVPVGGEKNIYVDVRIICATNRNLKEMVAKGLFREDLYYRLAVIPINMPPLHDRKTDIPLLIDYFQENFSKESGINIKRMAPDALNALVNFRWPGNVRELANVVQYAMIQARGNEISLVHLPAEIIHATGRIEEHRKGRKPKLELKEIKSTLKKTAGNKAKAAQLLGVSRTTLYRYLETQKV